MSEPEDLELEALQRQLDDAFETTRPRAGFEDELWTKMQARRPAGTRLRDAWMGLIQGIREVPAVPMAAVAAVLVVVLGAGVLVYSGLGRGGGGASTANLNSRSGAQPASLSSPGAFGQLPSPRFAATPKGASASGPAQPAPPAADYAGQVALTWTGKLDLTISSAPVFRYHEPSTTTADQFATALGAVLVSRPAGYLGSYQTSGFSVRVRGTVQSPALEPTYTVLPITSAGAIDAAGGPVDMALVFLAERSLAPSWQYTPNAVVSGDVSKVSLYRQFGVTGYGYANLVDGSGERYGIEVDLNSGRPVSATGPVPLNIESAQYPIISADQAIQSALGSSPVSAATAGVPTATLTSAELVYSLVAAGDHSFYEPSILFSGTFTVNGATYVKRVLVPAVDPAYRSS
ncbi:MAG TPA: hypothetical protein VNG04_11875 [Candidatus Acidoferrum sp.]|nr:hypothetical protein [Candidatus Acidoferrum sp.]